MKSSIGLKFNETFEPCATILSHQFAIIMLGQTTTVSGQCKNEIKKNELKHKQNFVD